MPPFRGQMIRDYTATTVTFPSGSPTSNAIRQPQYALGLIWLASGCTGFYLGANVGTAGGTLTILKDRTNSYVGSDVACTLPTAQLAANFAVPMPSFWYGADSIQLIIHDGTGSGIPQSSARVCTLSWKS